jgi:AmmeMemoRadiSam system protein B
MINVRRATFAGSWYPDSAAACKREIQDFLRDTSSETEGIPLVVGGIVPHAGWYFSGSIACQVIHTLLSQNPPDVIAIFGMHLRPNDPNYLMSEGAWETPFGPLSIDRDLAEALLEKFSFNVETATSFTQDNTIELQLPFIKYFSKDTTIVPMGVPPKEASLEIGRAVVKAADEMGKTIKVIGSTDLTHYGTNYGFTSQGSGEKAVKWVRDENDKKIIDTMLGMDSNRVITEALSSQNACCAGAAATAIECARQLGANSGKAITYATSYDKSPGDSFVGYVGIVFETTEING